MRFFSLPDTNSVRQLLQKIHFSFLDDHLKNTIFIGVLLPFPFSIFARVTASLTACTVDKLELVTFIGSSFAELDKRCSLCFQLSMVAELASLQQLGCTIGFSLGSNPGSGGKLPRASLVGPLRTQRRSHHKLASPTRTTTTTTTTCRENLARRGRKLGSSKLSGSASQHGPRRTC